MNREAFEANYASSHDLPLETFSQYRMGDTYRLPGIASHWRTWCSALESVVVELPERLFAGCPDPEGPDLNRVETIEAIEAAGLKVAP
jgi:hypothetical protein